MFNEIKNTIRLIDTDGIEFDLNINVVDGVVGTDSADNAKSRVHIISGETITVKETAVEVMQKIVNARFGLCQNN